MVHGAFPSESTVGHMERSWTVLDVKTWRASGRRHEKRVAAIVRTHRFRYFSPFLDLWDQVKPMSLQQWLRSHLNPPSELPQRNSPRELAPLDHGCDPPVGGPPSPAPQRLLVFGVSEWAGVSPRKSNQSQSFNQNTEPKTKLNNIYTDLYNIGLLGVAGADRSILNAHP